jgi:hyperosmotically inducible protein
MNGAQKLAIVVMLAAGLTGGRVLAAANDDRIEDAFRKSYVFRTQLTNDSIHVESKDGVVTLTGTASSEHHKALAEDVAQNLPGVQRVDDQLQVKSESTPAMSDAWIKTKVKAALLFHRSVSAGTEVDVHNGVVTLRGTANTPAEKDLTTEYAKDVDGVTSVDNQMTVASNASTNPKPTMSQKIDDASITAQVKFALLNHRSTSAVRTHVETKDGVVTITGTAKSQAEIDLVTKLVRDVDGVTDVKNEMTVGKAG